MFRLQDINGAAIVVDGGWIDKLDWGGFMSISALVLSAFDAARHEDR